MDDPTTQTLVVSICYYLQCSLEKIKPFKNVGGIQSASDKFKVQWAEFDEVEYNSTAPTLKTMEFIDCLFKKKDDWTSTPNALKVLHETFVALTKTSPIVFLEDWKKNRDFHPSPAASLWTAAIRVLGCAFNLKVQIQQTVKSILKNNMKDFKFNLLCGKFLLCHTKQV